MNILIYDNFPFPLFTERATQKRLSLPGSGHSFGRRRSRPTTLLISSSTEFQKWGEQRKKPKPSQNTKQSSKKALIAPMASWNVENIFMTNQQMHFQSNLVQNRSVGIGFFFLNLVIYPSLTHTHTSFVLAAWFYWLSAFSHDLGTDTKCIRFFLSSKYSH